MELTITGGAADHIPFNIHRYAKDHDKLVSEFEDEYMLDREFASPGVTFLRPPDDILKQLIADMKKTGSKPPEPKFITQQMKGLAYLLKGAISPGILHASHWYVSSAQRSHVIYMVGDKICLRDSETPDAKKQMEGTIAEVAMVTQNGSSIYKLKGEIPKGNDPIRTGPARSPVASPLAAIKTKPRRKRSNALFFGGGEVGCLPCELGGGALEHQARYNIMIALRDGDPAISMPSFNDGWAAFFVTSFCQYIFEGVSADASPDLVAAVKALLTGNPQVDALLLLEPMAETPLRAGQKLDPSHRYLIPDGVIEGWVSWLRTMPDKVQEMAAAYRGTLAEILNAGTSPDFTAARTEYVEHMRQDIKKLAGDDAAKLAFIRNTAKELQGVYDQIAASNSFRKPDGGSVQVFGKEAYSYLKARYSDQLTSYMQWATMVFFYCEALVAGAGADKFETIAQMIPGINFQAEVAGALVGSGLEAGFITAMGLISGGYVGYVRASLDALGRVGIRKKGGMFVVGGGFSHIDTAYREFSVTKRKTRRRADDPMSAEEFEVFQRAKAKRKKTKKSIKHLTKHNNDEAGVRALNAARKKRKRQKLRQTISQLQRRKNIDDDEEFEAIKRRKIRKKTGKLKRKTVKKRKKTLKRAFVGGTVPEAEFAVQKKRLSAELKALEAEYIAELQAAGKHAKIAARRTKKKVKKRTTRKAKKTRLRAAGDTTALDAMKRKRKAKKTKRKTKRKAKKVSLRAAGDTTALAAMKRKRKAKKAKRKTKRKTKKVSLRAAGNSVALEAMKRKRKAKKTKRKTKRKAKKVSLRAAGDTTALAAMKRKRKAKKAKRKTKRKTKKVSLRAAGNSVALEAMKRKRKAKKAKRKTKRKTKKVSLRAAGNSVALEAMKRKRKAKKAKRKTKRKTKKVSLRAAGNSVALEAMKRKRKAKKAKRKTKRRTKKVSLRAAGNSVALEAMKRKRKAKKAKRKTKRRTKKVSLRAAGNSVALEAMKRKRKAKKAKRKTKRRTKKVSLRAAGNSVALEAMKRKRKAKKAKRKTKRRTKKVSLRAAGNTVGLAALKRKKLAKRAKRKTKRKTKKAVYRAAGRFDALNAFKAKRKTKKAAKAKRKKKPAPSKVPDMPIGASKKGVRPSIKDLLG